MKYASDEARREAARQATHRFREAHPEYNRLYNAAHRLEVRAHQTALRFRRGKVGGRATATQIAARWAMWGDRCWMCGGLAGESDHVKPLSKGGSNWPANIRPACAPCNRRKLARWPFSVVFFLAGKDAA